MSTSFRIVLPHLEGLQDAWSSSRTFDDFDSAVQHVREWLRAAESKTPKRAGATMYRGLGGLTEPQ